MLMRRSRRIVVVAALVVVAFAGVAQAQPPASSKPAAPAKKSPTRELRALLEQPCEKLRKGLEGSPKLRNAMGEIAKAGGIEVRIDYKSFKEFLNEDPDMVDNTPIGAGPRSQLPLGDFLREVLATADASFVVRNGEVVVMYYKAAEEAGLMLKERVSLHVEQVPLAQVLERLADQTCVSLVIDPALTEKQQHLPLTISVQNARLNSVLRMIGYMTDLYPVQIEQMIYFTNTERGKKIESKEPPIDVGNASGADLGGGGGPAPIFGGPFGVAALEWEDEPLKEVLDQVAKVSGQSILVDPTVADKVATKVSAKFDGSQSDALIRILADMANLKAVQIGSIFYVTTVEKAEALKKDDDAAKAAAAANPKPGE
jgi:hypothetical protein